MKISFSNFLTFVLILSSFTVIKTENLYEWEDEKNGNYFNFECLKRSFNDPWVFKRVQGSFSDIYMFNFGQNVNKNCNGKVGSIVESYELMNNPATTCTILGDNHSRKIDYANKNYLNEGIYIEYLSKEVCMYSFVNNNSVFRTIRFYLFCSATQEDNFSKYYPENNHNQACIINFKILTPGGCIYTGFKLFRNAKILIFYLIALFILYISAGFYYKRKYKDLYGIEALPNIEFWRELPFLVTDGVIFSIKKFSLLVKRIKNKIHNNNSNSSYNDI